MGIIGGGGKWNEKQHHGGRPHGERPAGETDLPHKKSWKPMGKPKGRNKVLGCFLRSSVFTAGFRSLPIFTTREPSYAPPGSGPVWHNIRQHQADLTPWDNNRDQTCWNVSSSVVRRPIPSLMGVGYMAPARF